MAVPKRRRKLAETAEKLKRISSPAQREQKLPKAKKVTARKSSKKIDNAFAIMENIKEETTAQPPRSPSAFERLGFRIHISLDAVMPENKSRNGRKKPPPVNKSSILDIGLTIPFFWRMPIFGGIAQKVVQSIKTVKF